MKQSTDSSIGEKLKIARKSLGLSLNEVTKKMGFRNYQTLSNIESGKREVKAWELARLAHIYYRDINYFLSRQEDKPKDPVVLWREKTETLQVKQYERRFLNYCNNYHSLEQLLRLHSPKKFKPISCSRDEFTGFGFVDGLAYKYYNMIGLGSRPAWSLCKILDERFAVKILFLKMGQKESGASTFGDFGPAILINANDSPWRKNYDLAHEFFHLVTWGIFQPKELYSEDAEKSRAEKFADVFASALLLPMQEVCEEFENRKKKDNKISYFDCIEIAREFGVSIDALLWRLVNLNLIKRKEVEKVLNDPELRQMDRKKRFIDWKKDTPKFSNRYVDLAFRCMQLGLISRGIFAQYMEIDQQEIPGFLENYDLDENEDYRFELTTP